MSKSGRAAYDAQEQDRYADNYMAEEGERRHEIDQRITALEKSLRDQEFVYEMHGNTTYERSNVRRDATALTEYLRENGYPKQPETTQSDDIPF